MADVPQNSTAQQLPQSSANGSNWLSSGFGQGKLWQPIDFLIPGFTWLKNELDLDGSRAASAQASSQFALDNAAREFSSAEAEKQRQWEKMMADTAYQRQVADLKAAGLNPWLAVARGSGGAAVPSGSSASSSSGNASKADNKLAMAAGLIATALRIFLMKH